MRCASAIPRGDAHPMGVYCTTARRVIAQLLLRLTLRLTVWHNDIWSTKGHHERQLGGA